MATSTTTTTSTAPTAEMEKLTLSSQRCEPGSFNIPIAKFPPTVQGDASSIDAGAGADTVTAGLNRYLSSGDAKALAALFLDGGEGSGSVGYWRDHLALSWDFHTLKGPAAIAAFVEERRTAAAGLKFEVDRSSAYRAPRLESLDHLGEVKGVQFFVRFTTATGSGRGVVRLAQQPKAEGWKIWTLFTTLEQLNGFEEPLLSRRPQGVQHGERAGRKNWAERRAEEVDFEKGDPVVLIVGAGQAGLTIHARLKMLGVPALVIDRNAAIGDNWRRRYHQLVLHDPVWYDHMPYLPFPAFWPVYTPKDKLAEWFDAYARLLELNVWTSSHLARPPVWDEAAKTWTVTVERAMPDGSVQTRTLRPRHVVQATGHSGEKNLPADIPGMDTFAGDLLCHSSDFPGAKVLPPGEAKKRRAVVVGSCNSAHDICQDYVEHGYDVTMVQRSSTCVISSDSSSRLGMGGLFDEGGPPVEDADLWQESLPGEVLKAHHAQLTVRQAANDRETLEGLERAGFALDRGPDGTGLFMKYLQRGGGYYIDVGASRLIADGRIRVAQGQAVAAVVPQGLKLADGRVLEADEVVFATGYRNMRTATRHIFGDAVADRVGDVWGFTRGGELRTIWQRSGHPGFWLHGGNLAKCRYYSRLLALQIKSLVEGIRGYDE